MGTSRSSKTMRKHNNAKGRKVYAFPGHVWQTSDWRTRTKGKGKGKRYPLTPRKTSRGPRTAKVDKPKVTTAKRERRGLPRHVMEQRITSISQTHLSAREQEKLQARLKRADDVEVKEIYGYWSKKGKKKKVIEEPPKEKRRIKIPKKKRQLKKMTHIEKIHLLASCKQFDIDPQEIDDTLTYSENKAHLQGMARDKGYSEGEVKSAEKQEDEWASQHQQYLNHLKTELEDAGYEVREPGM